MCVATVVVKRPALTPCVARFYVIIIMIIIHTCISKQSRLLAAQTTCSGYDRARAETEVWCTVHALRQKSGAQCTWSG